MKKSIALMAVLMLSISLIGCTGNQDDNTITFAWWGTASRNTATYAAIAKFEEKYPQYTVEGDQYAWSGYQETLGNQLNRGSEADVFQVNYNWIYSMYGEDYFLDLHELDLDFSVYPSEEHDPLTVNNKILALSVSETGYIFYFNQNVYDEAGIETLPTTWDELISAGQVINANNANKYAVGRVDAQAASMLLFTYLSQKYQKNVINEHNELAFSEAELVEGFYFLDDLINNGVINITDSSPDGPSNPKWTSGNYGAVMTWNTAIAEYQDSLSVGTLVTGGMLQQHAGEALGMYKKISMAYAVSQRVGQSDAKKEAVKTFLEFMTTDPEAVEILGVDRGVSSILSVQDILENASTNYTDTLEWQGHFIVQELYDYELSMDVNLYIHPYYEHATFRKFYENIIESFLTAGKAPAIAAGQIYDGFNNYLATYMEG